MKRFMKFMSVILVLGAVATAEGFGGNPEVSVNGNNPTDTNYCDPYLRFLGYCRSVDNILQNN